MLTCEFSLSPTQSLPAFQNHKSQLSSKKISWIFFLSIILIKSIRKFNFYKNVNYFSTFLRYSFLYFSSVIVAYMTEGFPLPFLTFHSFYWHILHGRLIGINPLLLGSSLHNFKMCAMVMWYICQKFRSLTLEQ